MAVTAYDVLFSQRNSANNKFSETVIQEDPNGFVGFSAGNALGIYMVTDSDVTTNTLNLNKLVTIATSSILGRVTAGTGSAEVLTADNTITILNTASSNTLNLARIASIANNTLLGNSSGSAGSPTAQSADNLITIINTASTNKLNLARIANINNNTVLGNSSGSAGSPTAQTADNLITIINTGTTTFALATIPSITYAKIQNISTNNRVLGRITSGAGSTEELTANNIISILNAGGSTALNTTVAPGINAGNFTALFRNVSLGTVTTTQSIDVTTTSVALRLLVTATLSTNNVIFNFTNLVSGHAGMEIILIITNGGTTRNVTIQNAGATTNTTSGIDGYATTSSIPSGASGFTIFAMMYDGTKLHVNNLKYV